MSDIIRPEDLPNTLYQEFGHMSGPDLVSFINAAIKAEVVSPACSCYGKTLRPLLGVRFLFPGKPQHVWQEHWKGQTK